MGLIKFLCARVLPAFVLLTAIIVGWFAAHEIPMAKFFATVVPLSQGHWPPTIVGHGKMVGTPPVPDDMKPLPRPAGETFLDLPGGGGERMPQTGLGLCCRYSAYDDVLVYRSVLWYLLLGGRHLDGAQMYLNHRAVGRGIAEAVRRGVPRSEIFVTTKVSPTHFGYETTKAVVPKFLEELQLDYIDLILLHMPSPFPIVMRNDCQRRGVNATACRQETWRALSEWRAQGKVRNIGVSNFAVRHLEELDDIPGGAPVANNQIQYSPFQDPSVQETLQYCADHNITITAYSPLGGLIDKQKALAMDVLQDLAANKYQGRSVSQIMLRWAMECGTAVIPGTGNPKHMKENLDIYNFELAPEDKAVIDDLKHSDHAKKFTNMDVRKIE